MSDAEEAKFGDQFQRFSLRPAGCQRTSIETACKSASPAGQRIVHILFIISALLFLARACPSQQQPIWVNPGTGTISAALAAHPGPVNINLTCGTYIDNVVINNATNVYVKGMGPACTNIQPKNPSSPVVWFEVTGNGGGNSWDGLYNLQVLCPPGAPCGDGILVSGYTTALQGNNFLDFDNVTVFGTANSASYGFYNNIHIAGGLLTASFHNIYSVGGIKAGLNINTSNPVNDVHFKDSLFQQAYGYGVNIVGTGGVAFASIDFDNSVVQYNGYSTSGKGSLSNCAGMFVNSTQSLNIHNSYFEGNCEGNTSGTPVADFRLTGTLNQATSIRGTVFFQTYGEWGIYNDTYQTSGEYSGNRFSNAQAGVYIASSENSSTVTIASNFNIGVPKIVPDSWGNTHSNSVSPLGLDFTYDGGGSAGISGNTLTLNQDQSLAAIIKGPWTLKNILVRGSAPPPGRLLLLSAFANNAVTLNFGASGPGAIYGASGTPSMLVGLGNSIWLFSDGTNWHVVQ